MVIRDKVRDRMRGTSTFTFVQIRRESGSGGGSLGSKEVFVGGFGDTPGVVFEEEMQ